VGGRVGTTRPTEDSFAVVQIQPPIAGVRVTLNGQLFGRTDEKGQIFLPRLVSYLENRIAIEDKDIPIEYGIARKSHTLVPQPHAGYRVVFDVAKVTAASGSLRYRRGGRSLPLEFAVFTLEAGGRRIEFPTGSGGDFYLENLPAGDYPAEVRIEARTCRFTLSIPARDEPFITLPDVQACDLP